MTIQITTVEDSIALRQYEFARDAPRDTIVNGVVPNVRKCLSEYDWLAMALAGGQQPTEEEPDLPTIPDMSAYAEYHAGVVSQVTPFITMMYKMMQCLDRTPMLINMAAAAQGIYPPFNALGVEAVDPAAYGALLAETAQAIQAVGAAMQAMAQGGGE